jgi:hypothetical protein
VNTEKMPLEKDFLDTSSYSAERILWLDDLRNPFIDIEGRVPKENLIIDWVLNYEQFVQWIEKYGLPKIISFDHDLADEHYTPEEYWHDYQVSKDYQDAQNYQEKTGMDCAKWLVDYCIDNKKSLPIFYVHSANPVGADNIRGILNNYLKHCSLNLKIMTQEKANKIFATELGQQLNVIYVTSDDQPFIRHEEAVLHTNNLLNANPENFVDTSITEWYPEG